MEELQITKMKVMAEKQPFYSPIPEDVFFVDEVGCNTS